MTSSPEARVKGEHHHDHRDVSGGWLRPAVFGVMDGLVSNVSLIAGVAGAHVSRHTVVLTGMAGLVAGAFSMATGEYTSVRSQSEAAHAEIELERAELKRVPEAEAAELAAIYRSRGVDADLALQVATQLSRDPEVALKVHVREEMGVDPDNLPSPGVAAGSSFAAFCLGAIVPLLPYFFGMSSLVPALLLSAVSLFAAGATVSRFTNRTALFSGSRQLAFGAAAAGVTYLVGSLVGGGVS